MCFLMYAKELAYSCVKLRMCFYRRNKYQAAIAEKKINGGVSVAAWVAR